MNSTTMGKSETDAHDLAYEYRAISKAAVFGLVLALAGFAGLLAPTFLIFPGLGLVSALIGLRQIRRYPDELTGLVPAKIATGLSLVLLMAGGGWHTYYYATEVPDDAQRVAFWELMASERPMQPIIPPSALQLDGQRIFIKGYVHPSVSEQGNVAEFMLVSDMGTCCFGGQPKLTHMIDVKLLNHLQIKYSYRKRTLVGTFRVNPYVTATDGSQGPCYYLVADYVN